MENYDVLTTLIGSLGFPIVVCGVLFWYIRELTKNHKDEVDTLRSSIDKNTEILRELKEVISHITQR